MECPRQNGEPFLSRICPEYISMHHLVLDCFSVPGLI
jgi:hypothetical protein